MKNTDVMDSQAVKAFSELFAVGMLTTLDPGDNTGCYLYRSAAAKNNPSLSRDKQMILYLARWPESSDNILRRASEKYRRSASIHTEATL